jgi:hypothetical protein
VNERARRNWLVAGAVLLALLSIAGGALIALSDDEERARSTPSPTASTPSESASPSSEETESPSPEPTPEPTGPASLEDGRHFVYVEGARRREGGPATVRFDLAYFYRGDRAVQEAAERGDEVVNDSYIVNENPKLRTLPLAEDVTVRYIPVDDCCDLRPGNVDAWLESVMETNPTDYGGKDVPWWFTVRGGQVTKIQQQYLP